MDLAACQTNIYSTAGVVLGFGYGVNLSLALFPHVLLRRNIMRQLDGILDPSINPPVTAKSLGISAKSCGTLTAEENVVDLPAAQNVEYQWCASAEFFANLTSGGL